MADSVPATGEAAVAVSPFPPGLVFHSRPGAPNVLYLNFTGETVTNTQWNVVSNRAVFDAVAFSTDSDYSTFSDSEQTVIKRIWQRVAEDYAPFDIDVTTERPATFNNRTAHALITRNTDANGLPNPSSSAGGVAYIDVFSFGYYANYRPAWVYFQGDESYMAEAASHEIGHNMGLGHDGTSSTSYYGGHGGAEETETSWGPIMGTGYHRNVSQWCKGEYYLANNTEDDLAMIATKINYRSDDVGGTPVSAAAIVLTDGTNIVSTTPENDPDNLNPDNKGILERNNDVDVFSFVTGSGQVSITVMPWRMSTARTLGGNLDVSLELRSEAGALLMTNNPALLTSATIQTNLVAGHYYLHVRNTGYGSPLTSSPYGYTSYGSIGQYFISGYVRDPSGLVLPPLAEASASDISTAGLGNKTFTVTYTDDVGLSVATIDSNDIRVTGPNGYDRLGQFVSLDVSSDGSPRTATYSVAPPNNIDWRPEDNGLYSLTILSNQVTDLEGASVAEGPLASFSVLVPLPQASASSAGVTILQGETPQFQVTYSYGVDIDASTFDSNDIRVTGPNGYDQFAQFVSVNVAGNGSPRVATYTLPPPNGVEWSGANDGEYIVTLQSNQVAAVNGVSVPAGLLSTQTVSVLKLVYSADMSTDPGWSLEPDWEFGAPNYGSGGPTSGYTGTNIIGFNLNGNYAKNLAFKYATTPVIDTAGATSLKLQYRRWLGLKSKDDVSIEVTTNGINWIAVWSSSSGLSDGAWNMFEHTLPASVVGSASLQIRWGLASDQAQNDIGWNIDDVQVLATGAFDAPILPQVQVTLTVNNPAWGTVMPTNGSYVQGTNLQLVATPMPYYRFTSWTGDVTGTNNPMTVQLTNNLVAQAQFGELMTTNFPTPHWWLAEQGYSNDFETVVSEVGANGMPLWQSYIAGLDPNNPASQLLLSATQPGGESGLVLSWNAVTGRTYSLWFSTNANGVFQALPGAVDLPHTVESFTNDMNSTVPIQFYQLEVKKP